MGKESLIHELVKGLDEEIATSTTVLDRFVNSAARLLNVLPYGARVRRNCISLNWTVAWP
jgi:hypothetical protein